MKVEGGGDRSGTVRNIPKVVGGVQDLTGSLWSMREAESPSTIRNGKGEGTLRFKNAVDGYARNEKEFTSSQARITS